MNERIPQAQQRLVQDMIELESRLDVLLASYFGVPAAVSDTFHGFVTGELSLGAKLGVLTQVIADVDATARYGSLVSDLEAVDRDAGRLTRPVRQVVVVDSRRPVEAAAVADRAAGSDLTARLVDQTIALIGRTQRQLTRLAEELQHRSRVTVDLVAEESRVLTHLEPVRLPA